MYVRCAEEKGSVMSRCGIFADSFESWESREDSSRMAWVIVGWKRPPWGECMLRCVGKTWPNAKKVENVLC